MLNSKAFTKMLDLFDAIPAKCPVIDCKSLLKPQELLAHLLLCHRPEDSMVEIGAAWHTVYDVDLAKLPAGCNYVVGVIAYAGSNDAGLSRPIGPELQLVHHLPLMLMMYVNPPAEDLEQMYVLYLVSPVAARKVSARVSLLDGPEGREMRGLRCLRNFLDAPLKDSEELLHGNIDYLVYSARDVWKLCRRDERGTLYVKIVLRGEPNLFETEDEQLDG
ncbi:uncharacterized protein LOC127565224 isoform X2 [Drosophila albomicans]|uniref:Uncharacterized protein LOC127565224 isoform X2 n=1 Tax=Drosophila albomicans TaxID=7291 RepID=A0A9C6STG6_DROAB|nr:uncharacterized protein LOC127565224 isoform X2 [Drosophila albomicans]